MSKFKEILKKFQCPICRDYVYPPIPQCQNGHVICTQCKSSRSFCSICNSPFTNKRNETLEAIANDVPFPCKYLKYGCEEINHVNEKKIHELNCKYQPFQCPYCDMEIASQATVLLHHLNKIHENKPTFKNCVEIAIKMENLRDTPTQKSLKIHCILEKFGEVFIFSLLYQTKFKEWKFVLQMFAPRIRAEQFLGLIEMRMKNRSIYYEGPVTSWSELIKEDGVIRDCLALGESYFWSTFYGGILKVDIKPKDTYSGNIKSVASWGDNF